MSINNNTQTLNRSGNALSSFERTYEKDPNLYDYKGSIKSAGGYVRLRILSLAEDHVKIIPCRRINILSPKAKTPLTVTVQDLGAELEGLQDYTGEPVLGEKNHTETFRLPVWVYGVKPNDNASTPLDESNAGLYYIEVGRGIINALMKLRTANEGLFAFDEATGCPEYDIRLKKTTAMPFWEVEGIHWEGKSQSAHYSVPVEQVLADEWKNIINGWGDLMNAMQKPLSTLAEIKRQLVVGTETTKQLPISQKPALKTPDDYNFDNDTQGDGVPEQGSRFSGLRQ